MRHIQQFMTINHDQSKLSSEFSVPREIQPTLFPTEPTLEIKELKIIDSIVFSHKRKLCDFMISHTNADYTLQLRVYLNLEDPRCYAYKGFAVE